MNQFTNRLIPDEMIMAKILLIRGKKVIIANDLADLYGVTTKRLNEQVKRNKSRFPMHFMFQLTEEEREKVVANCDHLNGLKYSPYLPYVFTEHGTIMLANVLNSTQAIQVSIRIIEIFVKMRELLLTNAELLTQVERLERIVEGHDKKLIYLFQHLKKLLDPSEKPRKQIGYKRENEKN